MRNRIQSEETIFKTWELLSQKITQNFACLPSYLPCTSRQSQRPVFCQLHVPPSLLPFFQLHCHLWLPEGLQQLPNLSPCHQLCGQLPSLFSQLQFLSQVCQNYLLKCKYDHMTPFLTPFTDILTLNALASFKTPSVFLSSSAATAPKMPYDPDIQNQLEVLEHSVFSC